MGEEEEPAPIPQTTKEKLLFYTTAFFILLAIFSLFAFLFLVPFVIDPAFTTIFKEFDLNPAFCVTVEHLKKAGMKNCTWSSCKEGCTKDTFACSQIYVNYKISPNSSVETDVLSRIEQAMESTLAGVDSTSYDPDPTPDGVDEELMPFNYSEWSFVYAKLYPNVKGCGYPPVVICEDFVEKYGNIGGNFSCYYSKLEPGLVITELDMHQVYMNLVYSMAIPIPSFIISVIYLVIAYFKIYNEEPVLETDIPSQMSGTPLGSEDGGSGHVKFSGDPQDGEADHDDAITEQPKSTAGSPTSNAAVLTVGVPNSNSTSAGIGSLSKTVTTPTSAQSGPIVEL